jgi:hypothetical protein
MERKRVGSTNTCGLAHSAAKVSMLPNWASDVWG